MNPRNPTGHNSRLIAEDETPFERAARHIEKRTGSARDVWMNRNNPLNERHYRLMCRLAKVTSLNAPRTRQRAA